MSDSSSKTVRRVRLFKNGRNQAIRIPRDLELPGREALLYRENGHLVLEPVGQAALLDLIASWDPVDTSWPEIDDPAPDSVELPG
jgi:antitoxin VapB